MRTVVIRALLASGALSLFSLFGPPYVYCDQVLQLNCVQAWQLHQSLFPNWLISADPRNLSHDQISWEFWHAPGFPVLMAVLVSDGLSMGAAVHLLAIVFFMAGCVGWSLWALRFALPRSIHLTLPFLLPALRYGNDNLVHFHAEAFLFGTVPWLFIAALQLLRGWPSPQYGDCLLLGLAMGLVYFLKDSGLLPICGLLAIFAWATFKSRFSPGHWFCVAGAAALPVVVLSLLNREMCGTENLVTGTWRPHFSATALLYVVGAIPLTLTDAGQIAETVLLNPAYHLPPLSALIPSLGVPGALWLSLLLRRGKKWTFTEQLTLIFVATHLVAMVLIWMICDAVVFDRRFLAPASLAFLPFAISLIVKSIGRDAPLTRFVSAVFLLFYLLVPLLYGYRLSR